MLGMLAREARATWQAAGALRAGRPAEEIARALRRPPAAAAALLERARSVSPAAAARQLGALLGGRAPPQAGRRAASRAVAARRGSVRGLMARARRALAVAALLLGSPAAAPARRGPAARACSPARPSVVVNLPAGTPLGGYGGFPRRAWIPDLLGRYPDTFWFRPVHRRARSAQGRARSSSSPAASRVLWLSLDLVGVDPTLLADLRARLDQLGLRYAAVIAAASHTHSGPGRLRATPALRPRSPLDRESPAVRGRILDGDGGGGPAGRAAQAPGPRGDRAGRGRRHHRQPRPRPARPRAGRAQGDGRRRPAGRAGVELRHPRHRARPRATSCSPATSWADASARIEEQLGAPALFVNGAVGDVSPRQRGWDGRRGDRASAVRPRCSRCGRASRPDADQRADRPWPRPRALPAPALSSCATAWGGGSRAGRASGSARPCRPPPSSRR